MTPVQPETVERQGPVRAGQLRHRRWSRPAGRGARGLLLCLAFAACPGVPTPSSPVGVGCAQHSECATLPEGYCARAGVCTRECVDLDAGCPAGSACVSRGARRVCLPTCGEGVECAKGLACLATDAGFLCDVVDPLVAPPK